MESLSRRRQLRQPSNMLFSLTMMIINRSAWGFILCTYTLLLLVSSSLLHVVGGAYVYDGTCASNYMDSAMCSDSVDYHFYLPSGHNVSDLDSLVEAKFRRSNAAVLLTDSCQNAVLDVLCLSVFVRCPTGYSQVTTSSLSHEHITHMEMQDETGDHTHHRRITSANQGSHSQVHLSTRDFDRPCVDVCTAANAKCFNLMNVEMLGAGLMCSHVNSTKLQSQNASITELDIHEITFSVHNSTCYGGNVATKLQRQSSSRRDHWWHQRQADSRQRVYASSSRGREGHKGRHDHSELEDHEWHGAHGGDHVSHLDDEEGSQPEYENHVHGGGANIAASDDDDDNDYYHFEDSAVNQTSRIIEALLPSNQFCAEFFPQGIYSIPSPFSLFSSTMNTITKSYSYQQQILDIFNELNRSLPVWIGHECHFMMRRYLCTHAFLSPHYEAFSTVLSSMDSTDKATLLSFWESSGINTTSLLESTVRYKAYADRQVCTDYATTCKRMITRSAQAKPALSEFQVKLITPNCNAYNHTEDLHQFPNVTQVVSTVTAAYQSSSSWTLTDDDAVTSFASMTTRSSGMSITSSSNAFTIAVYSAPNVLPLAASDASTYEATCPEGFVLPDNPDEKGVDWIKGTGCAVACMYVRIEFVNCLCCSANHLIYRLCKFAGNHGGPMKNGKSC
jgi:hypothetical protein